MPPSKIITRGRGSSQSNIAKHALQLHFVFILPSHTSISHVFCLWTGRYDMVWYRHLFHLLAQSLTLMTYGSFVSTKQTYGPPRQSMSLTAKKCIHSRVPSLVFSAKQSSFCERPLLGWIMILLLLHDAIMNNKKSEKTNNRRMMQYRNNNNNNKNIIKNQIFVQ